MLEVWFSFPKSEEASLLLSLFEFAFMAIFFVSAIYVTFTYVTLLAALSFIIFLGAYATATVEIIKAKKVGRLVAGLAEKNGSGRRAVIIRSIFGASIIGLVVLFAFLSSQLVRSLVH